MSTLSLKAVHLQLKVLHMHEVICMHGVDAIKGMASSVFSPTIFPGGQSLALTLAQCPAFTADRLNTD